MNDYLLPKKLIVQQLRDNCSFFKRVLSVSGFSEARIKSLSLPAALVAYKGDAPQVDDDSVGIDAEGQFVTQQYVVLVVVGNQDGYDDDTGENDEAGRLIQDVIDALQGFQVSEGHDPLMRRPGMAPIYAEDYAYYPLTFETRFWSAPRP